MTVGTEGSDRRFGSTAGSRRPRRGGRPRPSPDVEDGAVVRTPLKRSAPAQSAASGKHPGSGTDGTAGGRGGERASHRPPCSLAGPDSVRLLAATGQSSRSVLEPRGLARCALGRNVAVVAPVGRAPGIADAPLGRSKRRIDGGVAGDSGGTPCRFGGMMPPISGWTTACQAVNLTETDLERE